MFQCYIEDVYSDEGAYYVVLDWWRPHLASCWSSYAVLICDKEILEELKTLSPDSRWDYGIAWITDVQKKYCPIAEYDGESSFLTHEGTLLIKGELIDYRAME